MKLLYCFSCQDVKKLPMKADLAEAAGAPRPPHQCQCGQSWGYYKDNLNAEYGGPSILLGINNFDLHSALTMQSKHGNLPSGRGRLVEAFIIPTNASTAIKRDAPAPLAVGQPKSDLKQNIRRKEKRGDADTGA